MFAPGSGRILSLYRQRQMRMERRDSNNAAAAAADRMTCTHGIRRLSGI